MAEDEDDENGSEPGEQRKPTLGNPDADPQRIHRDYLERHLDGGEPATPEAYERGIEQWHRLPGAISRPPAELRGEHDAEYPVDQRDPDAPNDEGTS